MGYDNSIHPSMTVHEQGFHSAGNTKSSATDTIQDIHPQEDLYVQQPPADFIPQERGIKERGIKKRRIPESEIKERVTKTILGIHGAILSIVPLVAGLAGHPSSLCMGALGILGGICCTIYQLTELTDPDSRYPEALQAEWSKKQAPHGWKEVTLKGKLESP